jgi:hypothetical protein
VGELGEGMNTNDTDIDDTTRSVDLLLGEGISTIDFHETCSKEE